MMFQINSDLLSGRIKQGQSVENKCYIFTLRVTEKV